MLSEITKEVKRLSLRVVANGDKAEMFVDGQNGVGFAVVVKAGEQYDFDLSRAEWERLKKWIDDELGEETAVKEVE